MNCSMPLVGLVTARPPDQDGVDAALALAPIGGRNSRFLLILRDRYTKAVILPPVILGWLLKGECEFL